MNNLTEAQTRRSLIDKALAQAGWNLHDRQQVGQEIPVDGSDPQAWRTLQSQLRILAQQGVSYEVQQLPTGISDYVLYADNGEILAVVEAKRTSLDPRIAQAQTEYYVTHIEQRQSFRPFAFMTNGYDIYFWDVGNANKRLVAGFFTPHDLRNLLYIRQHGTPLPQAQIDVRITDRDYQIEAIRRVAETFTAGKRKALIVMATGTGKTRTVMALIDLFLKAQQAQRVLFVADRDALVRQAINEGFQEFLPNEPCTRIMTHTIATSTSQRLFAATLQTLSNCFEHFSPAFFDLIIFDEVHRSIFNKWNEVLRYFDARLVGLTATPAEFIDRNTFLEFDCTDGIPTFLYTYDTAIKDEYLVDYNLYLAKTRFQRKGIRGVDLSEEERNALIEQGIDPDYLDYAGTDLEKYVSNKDTLRQQWDEIMEVCYKDRSGQLPGKTIVFAITQEHAFRLLEAFEEMFPQLPGVAQVITHTSDYKGQAIEKFKKEDLPRIAISVDMLDTGVNVPEVTNLVFMKPVQSRIKLEQMIGRGTRPQSACKHFEWLPNGEKKNFLILDFWENDFNQPADKAVAQSLPVLVTIFNTRLDQLAEYLPNQQHADAQAIVGKVRGQLDLIPIDAFSVRRIYPEIQHVWDEGFWRFLTQDKLDFLRIKVGPLLRYAPPIDVEAATFTSKVERLKLQTLTGRTTTSTVQSIAEDVSRLPSFVFDDAQLAQTAQLCLTPALATATPTQLDEVIERLAPHMKQRRATSNNFLVLDLPDFVETRGYIILTRRNEKVYVDDYRRRVEDRILELVAGHPTIVAIERGEAVSDQQLIDLERTLRHGLTGADLELSELNIRKAYALKVDSFLAFLRHLFALDALPNYAEIVERQFAAYLAAHPFTSDQVRFIRAVKSVLLRQRQLHSTDLYEAPFTSFGQDAVERLFAPEQVQAMLTFTNQLAIE